MVVAYIRVSTEMQSGASQRFELLSWASQRGIHIDRWVEESISGTVELSKRKLGRCIKTLKRNDWIVCTEISRLGRNMLMIMSILNECCQKGIGITTIKDNFSLDGGLNSTIVAFAFALAAEIERSLIAQRTKEALAERKAAGVVLGRPVGSSRQKGIVEKNYDAIMAMRNRGDSLNSISHSIGISRSTLSKWLKIYEKKAE